MLSLIFLRYEDEGETHTIRILEEVCNHWTGIGALIGLGNGRIEAIEKKSLKDPKECCKEVFKDWLQQAEKKNGYSHSWSGLLKLLDDSDLISLKKRLQKCLKSYGL